MATRRWGRVQTWSRRPAPQALAGTPANPLGPRAGTPELGEPAVTCASQGRAVSLLRVPTAAPEAQHLAARAGASLCPRSTRTAPGRGERGGGTRTGIHHGTRSPPQGPGPCLVWTAAFCGSDSGTGAFGRGRGSSVTGSGHGAGARLVFRALTVFPVNGGSGSPLG